MFVLIMCRARGVAAETCIQSRPNELRGDPSGQSFNLSSTTLSAPLISVSWIPVVPRRGDRPDHAPLRQPRPIRCSRPNVLRPRLRAPGALSRRWLEPVPHRQPHHVLQRGHPALADLFRLLGRRDREWTSASRHSVDTDAHRPRRISISTSRCRPCKGCHASTWMCIRCVRLLCSDMDLAQCFTRLLFRNLCIPPLSVRPVDRKPTLLTFHKYQFRVGAHARSVACCCEAQ